LNIKPTKKNASGPFAVPSGYLCGCFSPDFFRAFLLLIYMFALAIHGGAGTIARASLSPADEQLYRAALEAALSTGYELLREGAAALDAVEAAVRSLEDCPLFNAGRGAVFTHDGHHEMDAALMSGHNKLAGAVAGVRQVQNPIRAARLVMEHTEHVLLSYPGADELAREHGLPLQPVEYFFTQKRFDQLQDAIASGKMQLDHAADPNWKKGTVGAVARDQHGHLAAATSTGGMTNKRYSRIGDTPLIGAGTWADARCAISCTGNGEYFIRAVAAYDIACLMEYKELSLEEAARIVVQDKLAPVGGEGGLIAVDAAGNITLPFNSEGMYRASRVEGGKAQVAIYKE
jgi:beta-aspartyl-peptidase (threonine type)